MYKPTKESRQLDVTVRNLRYRVNTWGSTEAQTVFLLHGWMDVGMSFQAVADAMSSDWFLIAPDWRGFGDSQWQEGGYWFPDYYADLDALITHFSPDKPVALVGHSMGGNVVWCYAGISPHRVTHAVSLDEFGLDDSQAEQAVNRYRLWLEQIQQTPKFSIYEDVSQIERHLKKLAPNITEDYAAFVARHWAVQDDKGELRLKADPAHKRVNPVLYRREEARACWRQITAKTALILGKQSDSYRKYYQEGGRGDCHACFEHVEEHTIDNAGHMMHWEQPRQLAGMLEDILRA